MECYIREAMKLVDGGVKPQAAKPPPVAPSDLIAALKRNPAARKTFDGFPPGKQREYVDWLVEAKRETAREKRLAQAIEWLADGKARHWKYERC